MQARRPSSLFTRLLLGFGGVILVFGLFGLVHVFADAKRNQQARTAIENKAWCAQFALSIHSIIDQPERIVASARSVEQLRRNLFKELDYGSKVRVRIWNGPHLIYNSAPQLPALLPAPGSDAARHAYAWVSWVERDGALVIERSQEVDDGWMLTWSGAGFLLSSPVAALPFLLLPAWFIIRVGLAPLRAIASDIERRSASDLTALPATHYKELSPLIAAINRLMARLNERLTHEHEFLSDAAHELKTPLAAIQLSAHLLASRSANAADDDRLQEAKSGLGQAVARATHTVHQLLAFERTRAPTPGAHFIRLELRGFLRQQLARAATLAMARSVEIELRADAPCELPLHRESIASMLDNLIGNAIKYSPDGGKVSVQLFARPGGARLVITDQGPGIPAHLRNKVFERFYRVPGQDEAGTGLGLAIVERALARHGASIRLEAGDHGAGLRVVVDFVNWIHESET